MRPPPRFFKMHTLPLSARIRDPYADPAEPPATNLGIEQAIEIGWFDTPTGAIGRTAATAHVQYRESQTIAPVSALTSAFTTGGLRIDAIAFGNYDFRLRVQTAEGFGGYSDWVTVLDTGVA